MCAQRGQNREATLLTCVQLRTPLACEPCANQQRGRGHWDATRTDVRGQTYLVQKMQAHLCLQHSHLTSSSVTPILGLGVWGPWP